MKHVKLFENFTVNEKWTGKVQNVYGTFENFKEWDEMYGVAAKLGFDNIEDAWTANPDIENHSGMMQPMIFNKYRES